MHGAGAGSGIMAQSRVTAPHAATEKADAKSAFQAAGAPSRAAARQQSPGTVEAALAAFAHEVRTPLTGILAISDLLATSDLDERERRWVDTIKAGAEHLAEPGHAVRRCRAKPAAPAEVRRTSSTCARCPHRRRFAHRPRGGQGPAVVGRDFRKAAGVCDRRSRRLRAALENLIDNAVKFTEQGSVAFGDAAARQGQGRVALRSRQRDRPYARRDQAAVPPVLASQCLHRTRFGGAGLGLSSVKQLARAMGGDITVSPRKGGGTTFTP